MSKSFCVNVNIKQKQKLYYSQMNNKNNTVKLTDTELFVEHAITLKCKVNKNNVKSFV